MITFDIVVPSSNYSTTFKVESNDVIIEYNVCIKRLFIRYKVGNRPNIITDNGERWQDWNQSTNVGVLIFEDVSCLHVY